MDWKELGTEVAKIGLPLLGMALPIPGGAELGAALAARIGATSSDPANPVPGPADILKKLTEDATARAEAQKFQLEHEERILDMTQKHAQVMREQDSKDIAAVNATMQEELKGSKDEAWYQKAWRPFNGFVVGAGSFCAVLFTCYLFYKAIMSPSLGLNVAAVINVIPQLAMAIAAILAVPGAAVGITAWHRGVLQREQVKGEANA